MSQTVEEMQAEIEKKKREILELEQKIKELTKPSKVYFNIIYPTYAKDYSPRYFCKKYIVGENKVVNVNFKHHEFYNPIVFTVGTKKMSYRFTSRDIRNKNFKIERIDDNRTKITAEPNINIDFTVYFHRIEDTLADRFGDPVLSVDLPEEIMK